MIPSQARPQERGERARAYYNEIDPFAAAWLRELIKAGLIADGDVDERSIADVQPDDLAGYTQCHFFAGIGGWSYALRLAGWDDARPVWTGSCPCQPFSSASNRHNTRTDDERHLWPTLARLIASGSPRVVIGEQIAQAGDWLEGACDDLEAMGYEVGAAILPAVALGFDHARARLYFVGHANSHGESSIARNATEAPRLSRYHGDAGGMVPAHGVSSRMAALRGFGNAIVPQVAAAFIEAYLDAEQVSA
jgi:DNA (cytosine-5)-methyltransferase 1